MVDLRVDCGAVSGEEGERDNVQHAVLKVRVGCGLSQSDDGEEGECGSREALRQDRRLEFGSFHLGDRLEEKVESVEELEAQSVGVIGIWSDWSVIDWSISYRVIGAIGAAEWSNWSSWSAKSQQSQQSK